MNNQNNKDNDNNKGNNNHNSFSMMFIMIACCLVPILIISVFGISLAGSQKWLVFGGMAVFLIICSVVMNKFHHNKPDNKPGNKSDKDGPGNSHKRGCC